MGRERRETEAERLARYAAKDVLDKLGVRPGMAVRAAGAVDPALRARARAKAGRPFVGAGTPAEAVLYWPAEAAGLVTELRRLRAGILPAGAIWVISAKRGRERAKRPYLPDTLLIPAGKAAGLVDNKVCSVSEIDSAMRFVIPRADRKARPPG